jgi:Cu+-exporting ATPase
MARDPVCGMEVDKMTANHETKYKGIYYLFCSEGCMKAFNTHPSKYLERKDLSKQKITHDTMGGCCGGGIGRGWLSYLYMGIMLLYLVYIFMR